MNDFSLNSTTSDRLDMESEEKALRLSLEDWPDDLRVILPLIAVLMRQEKPVPLELEEKALHLAFAENPCDQKVLISFVSFLIRENKPIFFTLKKFLHLIGVQDNLYHTKSSSQIGNKEVSRLLADSHTCTLRGQVVEAIVCLLRAVSMGFNSAVAWAEVAKYLADRGYLTEARWAVSETINCNPSSSDALILLAYTLEVLAEESVSDIDDMIELIIDKALLINEPVFEASAAYLLRFTSRSKFSESLVTKAVTNGHNISDVHLRAARYYVGRYDYIKSADHFIRALQIDPTHAMHYLMRNCQSEFLGVIAGTNKTDNLAIWLDEQLYTSPELNLLPSRSTPESLSLLKEQRQSALDKGLPSAWLITQGKSGSVSLAAIFNHGFALPSILYGLGNLRVIKSWALDYNRGGACYTTHLQPTRENIDLLKETGVKKIIVNVRDPRQLLVSHYHHVMKYKRYSPEYRLFNEIEFVDAIDCMIEDKLVNKIIPWTVGWLSVAKEIDVVFTTYEEFIQNRGKTCEKLLAAYGGDTKHFNKKAAFHQQPGVDYHFRKGSIDEWKATFSAEQVRRINDKIPSILWETFYWDP